MSKDYDGNTIAQIVKWSEDKLVGELQNEYQIFMTSVRPDDEDDEITQEKGRWWELDDYIEWDDREVGNVSEWIERIYHGSEKFERIVVVFSPYDYTLGYGPTVEDAVHDANDYLDSNEHTLDEYGEPEVEE